MKKIIVLLFALITLYFSYETLEISPPAIPGGGAYLYSPQNNDNLEDTFVNAIHSAKTSIVLITYTFKSAKIIQALNDAAKRGVIVKAIFDAQASSDVSTKLSPRILAIPRGMEGLMHLKFLIIDNHQTWLGSANITRESLKSHANLVASLDSEEFANIVLQKAYQIIHRTFEKPIPVQIFKAADQTIELRFLPDDTEAIARIKELMRQAKKIIRVAMFTFTREDLADALVHAKNRGVKVEVVLEMSATKKTNSKIALLLRKNGISVFEKNTGGLMHNKFMLVDDDVLEHGSANWTQAAFRKNDDYIMIISGLSPEQRTILNKVWKALIASN